MDSESEMQAALTRADMIKYLQAGVLFDAAKAYLAVHPLDAVAYVIQQRQQGSDLVSDRGILAVRTLIQFWEEDSHTDLQPEALETIPRVFKLKLRFLEEVRRTLDLNEATKNYLRNLHLADYEHVQVFLDHDQAAKRNLYQWASFSKGLSLQRYFAYIIIIALIFANEKSKKKAPRVGRLLCDKTGEGSVDFDNRCIIDRRSKNRKDAQVEELMVCQSNLI